MANVNATIRNARSEIERVQGIVTSVEERSKHIKLNYRKDGVDYFILLNRSAPYPTPHLRRVIRQKFAHGHGEQYT